VGFFFIILQEILIYSPRFLVCSLRVIFWQKDTCSPRSQGQLHSIILQEYYKVSLRVIIVLYIENKFNIVNVHERPSKFNNSKYLVIFLITL